MDTIFEIGGQDAKYTYITNGVPCDYAMNEACSAGTGSFLEESAKESLGVGMEEIGAHRAAGAHIRPISTTSARRSSARTSRTPPRRASPREDIVAGLVYSICMNYIEPGQGQPPGGEKVFMQGGVCYNGAVPLAMAALTGKHIIVPPEPGLMGAFGVALEVEKRIESWTPA